MDNNASIGVVYLLRQAEGLEAPRRFIASYRRWPAGLQHLLIVLYKGFATETTCRKPGRSFGEPRIWGSNWKTEASTSARIWRRASA